MKLKTYFTPKVVRIIAVLFLLLVLVYAAATAFDVLKGPEGVSGNTPEVLTGRELEEAQQELLAKSLPPQVMNTPERRKQQAEILAAATKAEAAKQAEQLQQAANAKKVAEEKAAVAKEEMGKKIAGIVGDCRAQNKEWFACKTDVECAEVIGVCGARDAVNRAFRQEVTECNRAAAVSLKCDPFVRERTVPRCVSGVCVAQKQEAKTTPKTP